MAIYSGFAKKDKTVDKGVEREKNWLPIKSGFKKYMEEEEGKKIKRIPEVGAKYEQRMKESLGMNAPQKKAATKQDDFTSEETSIFRKLHGTSFDPKSKRDRQLLEYIKSSAEEAGGYGDIKKITRLAYAKQYKK